jgi:hypothetical protein
MSQRNGILNPPQEAAVCRKMIDAVAGQLQAVNHELATVVLDRERYLQKMGRAECLRETLAELRRIYAREFEV